MLKLYYPKEALEENTKKNLEDLVSVFSQFYKFNEEAREEYIANSYISKIVGIASNLNELIESYPDEYKAYKEFVEKIKSNEINDNLDPRDHEIDGLDALTEKFYKSENRFEKKLASFVMFNSLLYLAGKEINKFEIREKKYKKEKLKWRLSSKLRIKELTKLYSENLDYVILPFRADMQPYAQPFFENKSIYGRFDKENFKKYIESLLVSEIKKNTLIHCLGTYDEKKLRERIKFSLELELIKLIRKKHPEELLEKVIKNLEQEFEVSISPDVNTYKNYLFVKMYKNKIISLICPPILNHAYDFKGVVIAGVVNKADNFKGVGITAGGNLADNFKGVGIAGILNGAADNFKGVGIAAGANIVEGNFKGVGIAPINYVKKLSGIQIGLVNYAKTTEGFYLQVGLLNFSNKKFAPLLKFGRKNKKDTT